MASLRNMRRRVVFTCSDVNEFLTSYAEGELEEDMRQRFERHVDRCPSCGTYLDQYRKTVDLVKASGREPVECAPEELVQLTLAFLREHYDDEP